MLLKHVESMLGEQTKHFEIEFVTRHFKETQLLKSNMHKNMLASNGFHSRAVYKHMKQTKKQRNKQTNKHTQHINVAIVFCLLTL